VQATISVLSWVSQLLFGCEDIVTTLQRWVVGDGKPFYLRATEGANRAGSHAKNGPRICAEDARLKSRDGLDGPPFLRLAGESAGLQDDELNHGASRNESFFSSMGKRAKRAIIVSQRTRHIARLAQILHCAKNACSG